MDYVGLGLRIRAKRKQQNMKQTELAEQCGISVSHLGLIERGVNKASLDVVVSIANALGVGLSCLLVDSMPTQDVHYIEIKAMVEKILKEMGFTVRP